LKSSVNVAVSDNTLYSRPEQTNSALSISYSVSQGQNVVNEFHKNAKKFKFFTKSALTAQFRRLFVLGRDEISENKAKKVEKARIQSLGLRRRACLFGT